MFASWATPGQDPRGVTCVLRSGAARRRQGARAAGRSPLGGALVRARPDRACRGNRRTPTDALGRVAPREETLRGTSSAGLPLPRTSATVEYPAIEMTARGAGKDRVHVRPDPFDARIEISRLLAQRVEIAGRHHRAGDTAGTRAAAAEGPGARRRTSESRRCHRRRSPADGPRRGRAGCVHGREPRRPVWWTGSRAARSPSTRTSAGADGPYTRTRSYSTAPSGVDQRPRPRRLAARPRGLPARGCHCPAPQCSTSLITTMRPPSKAPTAVCVTSARPV